MKATFTLLFTFITLTVFAQRNFVPGQYTTLQGEVIQTHIDDQNWERHPKVIEVKNDLAESGIKKLKVSEIKGFSLSTGDVFESFIVDVDKSPTNINQIVPEAQTVVVRDTVFLRTLVKGNASLYHLKDESAKEHFYIRKGLETPVELIYQTTKIMVDSRTVVNKSPIYKGMLGVVLTDCPEVSGKISKVAFTASSLKKVVMDYNECVGGSKGEYAATEEKIKINLLALGGITYNKLNITTSSNEKDLEGSYEGNTNITFGASLLATLPRGRQKWAIQADLMYKPYKANNNYEQGTKSDGVYTSANTTFDLKYLGVNTAVRYSLLADAPVRPYVSVGIANNFIVSDNSNQVYYQNYYTVETHKDRHPIQDGLRKHEQAIIVGLGVEMKKILAEIKLEKGNGFSPFVNMKTDKSNVSVQVGYRLK